MNGIIQNWLLNELAINVNIKSIADNNIFQDGCVFADILQKYGLLNSNYNLNIISNKDPKQCTANLKLLKPTFDLLGVHYDENVTQGIVENNSSVILKLLYELYICLENKQQLYFIKTQNYHKIQKNLIQNLGEKNISVNLVEEDHNYELPCFEQSLLKKRDIIDWYRNKYKLIKQNLDQKLQKVKERLHHEDVNISKYNEKTKKFHCNCHNKEEKYFLPDLDKFSKYDNEDKILSYDQFIALYKKKLQHDTARKNLENTIQNELLSETWSKIMERQKEIYNSVFAGILLKQSQYEKQIVSKLIQTQSQIKVENENRTQVQTSLINEQVNQISCDFKLKEEFEDLKNIYDNEQKRVLELHRKIYREKQDLIKQRHVSLCGDIVEALIDLAINLSEYHSNYGVCTPKRLWDNLTQLFIHSQPIRIPFQSMESDIVNGKSIVYDDVINFEKDNDKILNENDVNEYLFTYGRWFYKDVGFEHDRLTEKCLAFIVDRLLSSKYPPPPSPLAADLAPFKLAGVLLGIHNPEYIEKLKILLSKQRVHVFDTEIVIKKSIDTFLKETTPSVENKEKKKGHKSSKSINAKDKSKKKGGKTPTKKSNEKKKGEKELNLATCQEKLINLIDKETQTSIIKEKEEETTMRTNMGLIGENIFLKLKNGEMIDDDLFTSVIIEYLKTLEDSEGWLILNYPLTINQAFVLELALTGKYLPINDYIPNKNEKIQDDLIEKKKSRLLSCPTSVEDPRSFETYFSFFIKAKENITSKSELQEFSNEGYSSPLKNNEVEPNKGTYEPEMEMLSQKVLEIFYKDQSIYKEFIYDSFDIVTLKKLARVILGDEGTESTNSIDLFGEEFLCKLTKNKHKDQKEKDYSAKKKHKSGEKSKKKVGKEKQLSADSEKSIHNAQDVTFSCQEGSNLETEKLISETPADLEFQFKLIDPGDKEWVYVLLPINKELAVLLATVWENIENCYINNLLDIFFEHRIVSLCLIPYSSYVQEEVKNVMYKNDLKQNVVDVFKNYFNSINRHLRELPHVKSHLHCKVLEMQQNLWQLADNRKEETESKRQEVIFQNWLVSNLCMLINNYLSVVQTELSRSIDTMKLINDYYLSMLDRELPSNFNIQLEHLQLSKITEEKLLLVEIDSVDDLTTKKSHASSSGPYIHNYNINKHENNFIAQSLIHCTEKENILKLLRVHLNREILKATSNLISTSKHFHKQIKIEEHCLSTNTNKKFVKDQTQGTITTPRKNISQKSKKKTSLVRSTIPLETNKSSSETELLLLEWKFVIDTEMKRFNFRMELIKARSNEDIMEFYCYIESAFCNLRSLIMSSYKTDLENINSLCEYVRIAIEEELPLNLPLVFSKGSFFLEFVEGFKSKFVPEVKELCEESNDITFTVNQLHLLLNVFKIAGPNGTIRKQSLCYIIQDLMLVETGDHQPYLPKMWNRFNESELTCFIDKMFGPAFFIDWRDFIIYNLEICYPSVVDILSLRQKFLFYDPENKEVISLQNFVLIKLWFENDLPDTPQQGLRIMLIKELLCKMFQIDDKQINYTALLLYFCKDFDPKIGLKKALSLSVGKNVIVSAEEYEKVLADEAEIENTIHNLLSDIIRSIVISKEGIIISEVSNTECLANISFNGIIENYASSSSSSSVISSGETSEKLTFQNRETQIKTYLSTLSVLLDCNQGDDGKQWTNRIPTATVISVFNAAFLNQDETNSLKDIYLNCIEKEADNDCMIEVPKLVNLRCVQKIFALTNKFKIITPKEIFAFSNKTEM